MKRKTRQETSNLRFKIKEVEDDLRTIERLKRSGFTFDETNDWFRYIEVVK